MKEEEDEEEEEGLLRMVFGVVRDRAEAFNLSF